MVRFFHGASCRLLFVRNTSKRHRGQNAERSWCPPGAQTCGEFAFDLRVNRNTENTYFDWAEGFISGMNWTDVMNDHTAKNIMALSVADQKQLIRDYCNEHPLASYVDCT
jgi:hypothetical protein